MLADQEAFFVVTDNLSSRASSLIRDDPTLTFGISRGDGALDFVEPVQHDAKLRCRSRRIAAFDHQEPAVEMDVEGSPENV